MFPVGGWRQESQSRLSSLPIVKDFDVLGDILYGFGASLVAVVIGPFRLEYSPKAFDRRIVLAVALAAHRSGEAVLL